MLFVRTAVEIVEMQLAALDADIAAGRGTVVVEFDPVRGPHRGAVIVAVGHRIELIAEVARGQQIDLVAIDAIGLIPGVEGDPVGHGPVPVRIRDEAHERVRIGRQQPRGIRPRRSERGPGRSAVDRELPAAVGVVDTDHRDARRAHPDPHP